jgi:hypothetical protein
LKYRAKHRQKLGYGADGEDMSTAPSETIATEFKDPALYPWDAQSESNQSMASYGNLTMDDDEEIAHLNPPEGAMAGKPFECELCCHIIKVSDRQSWMRHVFSDLMPYVCIVPDCSTADRVYERRQQWVEHLTSHRPSLFDLPPDADPTCLLCQKKVSRGFGLRFRVRSTPWKTFRELVSLCLATKFI